MKYEFEEFKEFGRRSGDVPKATLTRAGNINFNKRFVDKFWDDVEDGHVIFHYDKGNKVIGLEIAYHKKPNAYPLRILPSGSTCTVSARAFLKHNEIPFEKSRSYKITIREKDKPEPDFFIIDLKQKQKE